MGTMRMQQIMKRFQRHLRKRWVPYSLVAILAVSALLRFLGIGGLGLSSPDGGNYIRMSTWLLGHFGRPMYWAPPLFPISIAAAFLLFGIIDYVAIAVAGLFGVLLVLSTFLLGREAAGDKTGIIAALVMSVTEYGIIYSRDAMVDSAFAFFASMGFLFFLKAQKSGRLPLYAAYGFLAGLAFLTKYLGIIAFIIPLGFVAARHAWLLLSSGKTSRKNLLSDGRGFLVAGAIMSLMHVPWIFCIGIGLHASSGGSSYFTTGDLSPGWIIGNAPDIMRLGIQGYLAEFLKVSDISATMNTPNYLYYIWLLAAWTSPVFLLTFLMGVKERLRKGPGGSFMLFWFVSLLLIFTFIIMYRASRIFVLALPPFAVISSLGLSGIRKRQIFFAVLALGIASSIILSFDSIIKTHDGFRKTADFIKANVGPGDLIFYTGMPQLLVYHDLDTGNWWRFGDYNRTGGIKYVIIEYHAYRKRESGFGFFDLERFEEDFSPVAVFNNEDPVLEAEYWAAGLAVKDLDKIKIYRPDEDISGYFNRSWSS